MAEPETVLSVAAILRQHGRRPEMKFTTTYAAVTLLAAALAAQPLILHPAQAAKSGKAVWDAYITWHYSATIDSGVDKGLIGEGTGLDVLVKGDPGFPDMMAFHCVGTFHVVGETWKPNGNCVKTDKDGDSISYIFTPDDKFTWGGGTGKYKGMTGGGTEKVTWQHEMPNGDWAAVIRHEGTFQLP